MDFLCLVAAFNTVGCEGEKIEREFQSCSGAIRTNFQNELRLFEFSIICSLAWIQLSTRRVARSISEAVPGNQPAEMVSMVEGSTSPLVL